MLLSFKNFIAPSLYEEFLTETTDDPSIEGKVSNDTKGKLHELLVGWHLNGGKHMSKFTNENGETPEQHFNRLKSQIHPNTYEKINRNAKSAAIDIEKNIQKTHPGHKIDGVNWTSCPGDTEKVTGVPASQKEDSSDIYVTTRHPKTGEVIRHGISLKVSDGTNKNVPSSNLGVKSSGEKTPELFKEHQDKIKTDYPELKTMRNQENRKEWAKANPEKHAEIKKRNINLLRTIAGKHAAELQEKLNSGNHEEVVRHIRDVLSARNTPAANNSSGATFRKHTTYETAKGVQHAVGDPANDHEHILNDHKNITIKSSGKSVHYYYKGKKFASQAHKFSTQSDPLSSIKSSGLAV
jgi:hypothetical protein